MVRHIRGRAAPPSYRLPWTKPWRGSRVTSCSGVRRRCRAADTTARRCAQSPASYRSSTSRREMPAVASTTLRRRMKRLAAARVATAKIPTAKVLRITTSWLKPSMPVPHVRTLTAPVRSAVRWGVITSSPYHDYRQPVSPAQTLSMQTSFRGERSQ